MTISIEYASPRHPEIRRLLQASHDLMGSLFPAESNHFLEVDALCDASIHFLGARVDGIYQACGALAVQEGYGELKSIFTAPPARGTGLGQEVIRHLEDTARELGLSQLKLETGSLLNEAQRLYHRHGLSFAVPLAIIRRQNFRYS